MKFQSGVIKVNFGAFSAEMSCLRPVLLVEVISRSTFMIYAMDKSSHVNKNYSKDLKLIFWGF